MRRGRLERTSREARYGSCLSLVNRSIIEMKLRESCIELQEESE